MEAIEPMLSIVEMMRKIGLDPEHIKSVEYRKAQVYLMRIILRTEKVLLKIQEDEGLEQLSDRQKSVTNTLKELCFAHGKMSEMEAIIFQLRQENELLNERLKLKR